MISAKKDRLSSIERKAHIQKDIVNLLESSLLLSKSKKSSSQVKRSMMKENIYRSSSQEAPSKYKIRGIQTEYHVPSTDAKKETLSKNEIMLLEKILEKDDEIKELRNKLDLIQTYRQPSLNNTRKLLVFVREC